MKLFKIDYARTKGHAHRLYLRFFFRYLRNAQNIKFKPIKNLYRLLFRLHSRRHGIELATSTKIGYGFCIWHPYNITIALDVVIGNNVTINKNVTIGREFRGERNGCPVIGNCVWIGANATIVGKINIGDDVLIAPNTFVNENIPSHSICFGNPCIVKQKENATENYIQNPFCKE